MNRRELILSILAAPLVFLGAKKAEGDKLVLPPTVFDALFKPAYRGVAPYYPPDPFFFRSELVCMEQIDPFVIGGGYKVVEAYTPEGTFVKYTPQYTPHRGKADIYIGPSRADALKRGVAFSVSHDPGDYFIFNLEPGIRRKGDNMYITYMMMLPSNNDRHGFEPEGHDPGMAKDCRKCQYHGIA